MNQETFFENFEDLADVPNGIQKLRELILQLAVQGKLVSQDLNDESVSILMDTKKKLTYAVKSAMRKKIPQRATIYSIDEPGSPTLRNDMLTDINCMTARDARKMITKAKNTRIPLPPFPEQERIVAILDEAFAAIATATANAEKRQNLLAELKQSILHKAFTGELTADFNAADVALSKGEV